MKAVILFRNYEDRTRELQPSKYLHRASNGIAKAGNEVTRLMMTKSELRIQRLRATGAKMNGTESTLFTEVAQASSLLQCIDTEKPDVALISVGPVDFIKLSELANLHTPKIAIVTYPIYSLRDILRAGVVFLAREWKHIALNFVGAAFRRVNARWILRTFDLVIVESLHNKEYLRTLNKTEGKICHIPPGVDKEFFHSTHGVKPTRIPGRFLYMGSALPMRGPHDLITAFSDLAKSANSVELRMLMRRDKSVVGDLENIEISAANVRNVSIVKSGLDKNQIRDELHAASVAVFPFRIVPSDMPVSPIEAKACGCRIIVTQVDGLPEMAGPGDIILRTFERNELANAMQSMLRDERPDDNRQSERYIPDWDEVGRRIADTLNRVHAEAGR